jgi:hypothetical protein
MVNGRHWYPDGTPLVVEADILYERSTGLFVGLTYAIEDPESEIADVERMIGEFDPNVVRVTDYSNPMMRAAYPESCQLVPHLEAL